MGLKSGGKINSHDGQWPSGCFKSLKASRAMLNLKSHEYLSINCLISWHNHNEWKLFFPFLLQNKREKIQRKTHVKTLSFEKRVKTACQSVISYLSYCACLTSRTGRNSLEQWDVLSGVNTVKNVQVFQNTVYIDAANRKIRPSFAKFEVLQLYSILPHACSCCVKCTKISDFNLLTQCAQNAHGDLLVQERR